MSLCRTEPACYFPPVIRWRCSSLQPHCSSVCQLGPVLHLGDLPALWNTASGIWGCSNTVQKLVSRGECIPRWVFCWVFRASLKTQRFCVLGVPGEEDLAVLSSLVHYPSGKTWVLEHLGRITVSWGWVWALEDIEPQLCAVVTLPVRAERRALAQVCPRAGWCRMPSGSGYYQAFTICFSTVNLLSLWHTCFNKYATVSSSKRKFFSVVRLNVCLLKLFLWIVGIAVLDQAKGLSISLQPFSVLFFNGQCLVPCT